MRAPVWPRASSSLPPSQVRQKWCATVGAAALAGDGGAWAAIDAGGASSAAPSSTKALPIASWPHTYGTFPKFYRDLVTHGTEVEEAVRKMTSLPANRLGLGDRGRIELGCRPDITIFDPAKHRTLADYHNPFVSAEGVHYVIVNGEIALAQGRPTGVKAGRMLLRTVAR